MLQFLKKLILGILVLVSLIVVLLFITGNSYILKGIRVVYFTGHTTAFIDDHVYFDTRKIEKGTTIPWAEHQNYNTISATETLDSIHDALGTVAYMIIKNDSIWYEKYAEDYDTNSQTNSFSMAKTITTLLLGKAIEKGHIQSLDQAVSDFLPEFSEGKAAQLTVGDLASMAAGLNWDESYSSPFSVTARTYYSKNIRKVMLGLQVVEEPGQEFNYQSGATELLGMVIEKATGTTVSDFASQHFWKPMGMHRDGLWQLDSEKSGLEKTYCCVISNARDFARFGRLFNHDGRFAQRQIINPAFIQTMATPRFAKSAQYGYGTWLARYKGKKVAYMRGILGQYVISIPEDDLIIVRLGHKRSNTHSKHPNHPDDFFIYIEEAYKMLGAS